MKATKTAGGRAVIPAVGQGKRGSSGHLQHLLSQANGAMRLTMDRALADLALTPPQYAVLTMVDAYPGITGADLARLTQLTPPTINVIVRNLRRDGLVDAAAPGRGRSIGLRASDEGKRLRALGRMRATKVEAWLAAGLSPAEEHVVRSWLVRVAERGGRFDPEAV